ncbi:shikimate dehydrogenase [Hyphobacterium sp. CCMP332]|nr:shikimate dehydrogenase [Hyphobacterium sp. CCMP332]
MRRFGLIGYPIKHSFSKSFFNRKFKSEGISDCTYENFETKKISDLYSIIEKYHLTGMNVTIPFKTEVLKYCDILSEEVKLTGAANTLKITKNKIKAFNTDWLGFTKSLEKTHFDKSKIALIIGSGGSSKAIQYALKQLSIDYKIISRNPKKTDLSYEQLNENLIKGASLIVNCSPLGAYPNTSECPNIPYHLLSSNHFCFDLVYNPEKTLFLLKSEKMGASIKNGMEMLILQAEESWKIWQDNY